MAVPASFKLLLVSVPLITLAACDSSSSSSDPLASQAVDGYIVGADVECDGVAQDTTTAAAGRFTCPAGTQLSQISGGFDVGIGSQTTDGTDEFTGVLTAPASEPYVTPLTTLAVAIARSGQSADGDFDFSNYETARTTIAQTLGIELSSFSNNPVLNTDTARTNAQVHFILKTFAPDTDSYEEAASALASVIAATGQTGGMISLSSGVDATLSQINESLSASSSALTLSIANLNQAAQNVLAANTSIENAESPARVVAESKTALLTQAPLTIVRNDANVILTAEGSTAETLTLSDFENSVLTNGLYTAHLSSDLTSVSYDTDVFRFNQDIDNATITVAFELKAVSTGDSRSISFTSDDVVISATRDNSDSLNISLASDQSTFTVVGTDSSGVTTRAVARTEGETLDINGDGFTINLTELNDELTGLGFEDILSISGNYSATLVISGISITEDVDGVLEASEVFTVTNGTDSISGNGFRGFVSITR